jgi:hypothetical protein
MWILQFAGCLQPACPAIFFTGAAKLLGKLTDFKMKYAQARAAQHPELKHTYDSKIKSMKAAGEQQQGEEAEPGNGYFVALRTCSSAFGRTHAWAARHLHVPNP